MSIPVLLIGFNRPDLIQEQLARLADLNVQKIYVAIDGGRNSNEQSICEQSIAIATNFKFDGQLFLKTRSHNLGCGLGVISALDWFFSIEPHGIVLEDDCVPSEKTFLFFESNLNELESNSSIGMISAHNPCIHTSENIRSSYIFINGWMTTSEKYFKIRQNIFRFRSPFRKRIPGPAWRISDAIYWWATATRVKLGLHDTWDSPFLENFSELEFKCLVPKDNLIQNVGFGSSAAHTKDENGTIFIDPPYDTNEIEQLNFDQIVRRYHFGIKRKHAVTPFYKVLRDLLARKSKDFESILELDRKDFDSRRPAGQ